MIGRNILANAIGGSWSALLSVAIIPFQIRILGTEAYGLLAFIASLQVIFSIFDFGLSPTVTREVATDASPDRRHTRELLQALTAGYYGVGLLLGTGLFLSADWLVNHWLNLGALPAGPATVALRLGALTIMLRWPVSFYSGIITGCQRFDILNLVRASAASLGLLGGIAVIVLTSSLVAFAAWMALAALVEATLYLIACFRLVPGMSLRPRFSRQVFGQVWQFAFGVTSINVLSIILTQSDRLMISNLLPIEQLGYYSLAYNVLYGLTLVQGFVTSAMFPVFASDHKLGRTDAILLHYRNATQGLIAVYALPIALIVFFGHEVLQLWTSPDVAGHASRFMIFLALGFFLNASVSISSTLAMAIGNIRELIIVNVVGLCIYLPGMYLSITRWGGVGAAGTWILLNVYYFVVWLPFVHHSMLNGGLWAWLNRCFLPFTCIGVVSFGLGRGIVATEGWSNDVLTWSICVLSGATYSVSSFLCLSPALKSGIRTFIERMIAGRFVPR